MSACAISNTVDKAHCEVREKEYLTLQKKYTKAEMQVMSEMLGMAVAALDENPDQDLLGEIFMTLGLGNEHNGQFFHSLQCMSGDVRTHNRRYCGPGRGAGLGICC